MRVFGMNYDTGFVSAGSTTHEPFDPETVRRDLRVIRDELHCDAVRVTGGVQDRLELAAGFAAEAGLEVWYCPFTNGLDRDGLMAFVLDGAERAERLRRGGAPVVYLTGSEIAMFTDGFLPGGDLTERMALFTGTRLRPGRARDRAGAAGRLMDTEGRLPRPRRLRPHAAAGCPNCRDVDRSGTLIQTRPDRIEPTMTWSMPRVTIGTERRLLEHMLDRNRAELVNTARGLSEDDARRRLVASLTTPIGLLKHAAVAERIWFQHVLGGLLESECDGGTTPGDASFVVDDSETLAEVIAEFERASERSRVIAAGLDLDDIRTHPRVGDVSLRFVYLLAIEDFARHAGHGDILREQITHPVGPYQP